MSRLIMLPCAAFLRVYEPLSAFGPAERSRWEAYATAASRPRRADSLSAERIEALRRIIALPPDRRARLRRAPTLTCGGQMGSRTCAHGRRGCGHGSRWAACGRPPGRCSRTLSRQGRRSRPPRSSPGRRGRKRRRRCTSRAAHGRCRRRGSSRSRRPSGGWSSVRRPGGEQAARNSVGHPYAHLRDDYGPGAPASGARARDDSPCVGAEAEASCHRPRSGGSSASYDHDDRWSAPGLRRSAAGLRSSIRIRWWSWTTGGWCSCSTTTRCVPTSP